MRLCIGAGFCGYAALVAGADGDRHDVCLSVVQSSHRERPSVCIDRGAKSLDRGDVQSAGAFGFAAGDRDLGADDVNQLAGIGRACLGYGT